MNFKKWVKSIQTAGYNGARTVCIQWTACTVRKFKCVLVYTLFLPCPFCFYNSQDKRPGTEAETDYSLLYGTLITVFCLCLGILEQFLNRCIQQDTFFADSFLVKTIVRIEVNQPFLIQVTYIKSVWTYRSNNHIPSFSIELCHIMCTAIFQGIDLQFLEIDQVVIEMSDQNQ